MPSTRSKKEVDGPVDESPRGIRRKRRSSSSSLIESTQVKEGLSRPSRRTATASPAPTHSPSRPRKKKARRVSRDDSQQLNDELDAALAQDEDEAEVQEDTGVVATENRAATPEQTNRSRKVRFSDPGPLPLDPTTPLRPTRSSGLTPQIGRTSLSPSHKSRPKRSKHDRQSLPARLPSTLEEGSSGVQQVQYAPLATVLDQHTRRRLRRSHLSEETNAIEQHKREDIRDRRELQRLREEVKTLKEREKELTYELESQRQRSIQINGEEDETIKKLEEELSSLRDQIADKSEQGANLPEISEQDEDDDVDMIGEDSSDYGGLTLVDPADLNLVVGNREKTVMKINGKTPSTTLVPVSESVEMAEAEIQVSMPDPTHEAEIENFERQIMHLATEAHNAKTALTIIQTHLQSLGFTLNDADADEVLRSIREAFRSARVEINDLLPGVTTVNLTNGDFLSELVENIRTLVASSQEKAQVIEGYTEQNETITAQYNGIVDKLADSDARSKSLEQQWHELDVANEKRAKTIIELEEEAEKYIALIAERDALIEEKDAGIDSTEAENEDLQKTIDKLNTALASYRDEVKGLEDLIHKMEADYKGQIEKLKDLHTVAVEEYEEKLATQTSQREEAEADADQKQGFITALELKIENVESELDNFREQLAQIHEVAASEKQQREEAEQELDDRAANIALLEEKVEELENQLQQFKDDLEALRDRLGAVDAQRVAAEELADDRQIRIEEMEEKLSEAGIDANSLRNKLWEVQQQKEASIKALNDTAIEREERYQSDMATEIERREGAEQTIADRDGEIAELKNQLAETEQAMADLEKTKDALIKEQEDQITATAFSLDQANRDYESLTQERDDQISSLHSDIAKLTTELDNANKTIKDLQAQALVAADEYQAVIEEKDRKIAVLEDDLTDARDEISDLEKDKRSLEQRVEDEVENMLELQENHTTEVQSLQSEISDRDDQIQSMEERARAVEAKYTEDVEMRDTEIEALRLSNDQRAVKITQLSKANQTLKEKYRELHTAAKERVDEDTASLEEALARKKKQQVRFADSADSMLDEVEKVGENIDVTVNGNDVANGAPKVKESIRILRKDGKKRRKYDSGIGLEEEESFLGAEENMMA